MEGFIQFIYSFFENTSGIILFCVFVIIWAFWIVLPLYILDIRNKLNYLIELLEEQNQNLPSRKMPGHKIPMKKRVWLIENKKLGPIILAIILLVIISPILINMLCK